MTPDVQPLFETVGHRLGADELARVQKAHAVAAAAHEGQERKSGDPYICHPVAVAQIVAHMGTDGPTVAAALLHDVVEDTALGQAEIAAAFGDEVASLVAGVTKISAIEAREKIAPEAESLRRMLLAAVDDLRVILIKLADRLHNMRTIDALAPDRRQHLASETLDIYAPLANRLGIWQLKSELEDLALRELQPEVYRAIASALSDRRSEHESYLATFIELLEEGLRSVGIEAQITSRTKHFYSIHSKMRRKEVGPSEINDVLAVRVLVDETEQCYLALGAVHTRWPPIDGEFDDYIAKPKNNLYQSLHTTVLGPGNRPIEVQIRTRDMHEVAEYGVAAHWLYKEGSARARELEDKIASLRTIVMSHHEDAQDAQAFVEGLKTDVFRDQVYVFTPQGQVVELPAGATAIDFAYRIHTEVGHRCRGAYVDGKIISLDTPLQTGQTVKIVTAKGDAGPSRDWLNPALGYIASSRARAKIGQWFRRQARETAVREGREVVERQLRKLGMTRLKHDAVAKLFGYDKLEEFLAAVGRSEIPTVAVGARLLEAEAETAGGPPPTERAGPPGAEGGQPVAGPAAGVRMRGVDGVFTRVARCCRPVPGENVIGYVTRGRGVTLHRADCHNIASLRAREHERFIRVDWRHDQQQTYPVELRITAYDRPGLVRDISEIVASRGVNIRSIHATASPEQGTAMVTAVVSIVSHTELTSLIDKLGTVENVVEVHRSTG